MDIDRAYQLLGEIADRQQELATLCGEPGKAVSRKPQRCGKCGQEGHSARTCTSPPAAAEQ